ncbi:MAG TPA: LytTR family DNA-binding domain-containing protein [Chitinophagaceae bacterium]|jgi:DNA-binding LytR/AlgR family response regulator|nr:LytTR family DNA-binding domain-containing protein [Chitinophagaceae bacterium]
MTKLSCLVVEDEVLLSEVLADYIKQVPFLELKTVFHDAISAVAWMEDNKVDLIFIDINLPRLKGIDFIKMFQGKTGFIITTAYHEYALQGYDLNVIDYLMKPVEFSRFLQAVKKAVDISHRPAIFVTGPKQEIKDSLFVNLNKKRVKVEFSDILYIEGMKEYVKIHLSKEKWLLTKLQMGQIEGLLDNQFVRIHRSYIVARKRVSAYNLTEVTVGSNILPVGTNYRESLASLLEK